MKKIPTMFDATGTTEDEAYSAGVKDALRAATSVFDSLLSRAPSDAQNGT